MITSLLCLICLVVGGVVGYLVRAEIEAQTPSPSQIGRPNPPPRQAELTNAERFPPPPPLLVRNRFQRERDEAVLETYHELENVPREVINYMVATDGLLARHIKVLLLSIQEIATADAVEDVKQVLLDENLVTQDQENRIWLRQDTRYALEPIVR